MRQVAEAVLGREAPLLGLFDQIKSFADKPDDAPSEPMPSGLNGYQRAMVHQYCEECGVTTEKRGSEPNLTMWLVKQGSDANISAAERFKKELTELVKVAELGG